MVGLPTGVRAASSLVIKTVSSLSCKRLASGASKLCSLRLLSQKQADGYEVCINMYKLRPVILRLNMERYTPNKPNQVQTLSSGCRKTPDLELDLV